MTEGTQDASQQQQSWNDFTKVMTWSCITAAVVLALMGAFLT
jgi:hypothetical protein